MMTKEIATHILEKSPDAILIQTDGIIRFANPAAWKLFGVQAEEQLLGLKLIDQVDEQFRIEAESRLNSLLNAGIDFTEPVERLYHRIDGSPIWVELVGARITYEDRDGTVIFFRDIQKRKSLEIRTKQMEHFYLSVLDSLPLSIVHFSKETGIHFVNRHYSTYFGQKPEPSDSHQPLDLMYPDPKIRHQAELFIEKATGEWQVFPVLTKTGEHRQFEWSNLVLENGDRMSIGIDVTDNLRAETRIKELLQEKELLLREVHHRIKNNMVTMTSLLTLQSEMTDVPEVASQLINARNRMRTMAALYEHLNSSGNLEHVGLDEYLEPLIQEIIENLDPPFSVDLDIHLESILIPVPKASLLGIIANEIVTNSLTHGFNQTDFCKIKVRCTMVKEVITIAIGDNGIGCDVFKLDKPGLGVQLISLLVEQLNGTVQLEPDQGTTFCIKVPLDV